MVRSEAGVLSPAVPKLSFASSPTPPPPPTPEVKLQTSSSRQCPWEHHLSLLVAPLLQFPRFTSEMMLAWGGREGGST